MPLLRISFREDEKEEPLFYDDDNVSQKLKFSELRFFFHNGLAGEVGVAGAGGRQAG